jgi:hypothetical protein
MVPADPDTRPTRDVRIAAQFGPRAHSEVTSVKPPA